MYYFVRNRAIVRTRNYVEYLRFFVDDETRWRHMPETKTFRGILLLYEMPHSVSHHINNIPPGIHVDMYDTRQTIIQYSTWYTCEHVWYQADYKYIHIYYKIRKRQLRARGCRRNSICFITFFLRAAWDTSIARTTSTGCMWPHQGCLLSLRGKKSLSGSSPEPKGNFW